MKNRILSICLWGLLLPLAALADPAKLDPDKVAAELTKENAVLSKKFQKFCETLVVLTGKLDQSEKPEDKARATHLKKVIALVGELGPNQKFEDVEKGLSAKLTPEQVKTFRLLFKNLDGDITAILSLLLDEHSRKEEIGTLKDLLNELKTLRRDLTLVRARADGGKADKGSLENDLKAIASKMDKVDGKMGGKNGQPANGDAKADPASGKANPGQPNAGNGQPGGDSQPGAAKPDKQPGMPGREKLKESKDHVDRAIDDLKKKNDPGRNIGGAIPPIDDLIAKLEDLLRQLREEEQQRQLADLKRRCERMLRAQEEINKGTSSLHEAISDSKPTRGQEQESHKLGDKENLNHKDADAACKIVQAEGSAVALAEAFQQVRKDMEIVSRRLNIVDVGTVTQVIEKDIVDTLREMIEALDTEIKNRQAKKTPPRGGDGGDQGPPKDPPLLKLVQELKMVKSMQVRVYNRTKAYPDDQAAEPNAQKELNELAQRQKTIAQITDDLYKEKNK